MASKYDSYWRSQLPALKRLLLEADRAGEGGPFDVSGVRSYGERGAWHGVVVLAGDGVREGEMAHARSLGNVILQAGLLELCSDYVFRLTISGDLQLTVRRLGGVVKKAPIAGGCGGAAGRSVGNSPVSPVPGGTAPEREKALLEILARIPWSSWEQVCKEEPEWQLMLPFLDQYEYGPFAVLMLAAGLNDYQLKGRAELAYWPPISRLLAAAPRPRFPEGLIPLLEPFYKKERYGSDKVRRLRQFLSSPLARQLWSLTPEDVSRIFPYVWRELAKVMNQQPQAKTISFAMKCLGLSLLMCGVSSFDFSRIPIPVDLRVVGFSQKAGLCSEGQPPEIIRKLWDRMLAALMHVHPAMTMIHLDSLVWQIAAMDEGRMLKYFDRIGASRAGNELCALLRAGPASRPAVTGTAGGGMEHRPDGGGRDHQIPADATSVWHPAEGPKGRHPVLPGVTAESRGERVICFIPCCGSKQATGKIIGPVHCLGKTDLPGTWDSLTAGRGGMGYCLEHGSRKTTALCLYTGSPYQVFAQNNDEIAGLIRAGCLRLFIISAGYGVLGALEPALNYDAVLQGKVAAHWKQNRLADVIAELLLQNKPAGVYGFFAGRTDWSTPGSKYRFFFTEGVKSAIRRGLRVEAGCFYRMEGQGVKAILGGLGRTFTGFMDAGFDSKYAGAIAKAGRQDGNVKIGFEYIKG